MTVLQLNVDGKCARSGESGIDRAGVARWARRRAAAGGRIQRAKRTTASANLIQCAPQCGAAHFKGRAVTSRGVVERQSGRDRWTGTARRPKRKANDFKRGPMRAGAKNSVKVKSANFRRTMARPSTRTATVTRPCLAAASITVRRLSSCWPLLSLSFSSLRFSLAKGTGCRC